MRLKTFNLSELKFVFNYSNKYSRKTFLPPRANRSLLRRWARNEKCATRGKYSRCPRLRSERIRLERSRAAKKRPRFNAFVHKKDRYCAKKEGGIDRRRFFCKERKNLPIVRFCIEIYAFLRARPQATPKSTPSVKFPLYDKKEGK